ncbi:MAG: hypothetical protein R2753_10685 [Chitinophagales bacterium]
MSGSESGLIGYWTFNEGSGQTSQDLSGNGHTAYFGNTANSEGVDPQWIEFCCNNGGRNTFRAVKEEDETNEGIIGEQVKVYPNPFRDQLVFDFYLEESESLSIEIYNTMGANVATVVREQYKKEGFSKSCL